MPTSPLPDEAFPNGADRDWCAEWEHASSSLPATTDGELLSGLTRPAHEADLQLLASIDPSRLTDPSDRVAYLQAVERVAALVAAMRADAVVAFAGARPSGAYLSEVHVEHELSVAARVSRYSAGRQIETARALEVTFPSFKAALRAGEITQGHCTVLVDRTRVVADPTALAALERVALPKARRMTPGEFARECAALVVRFDSDAAARTRRARGARRTSVRQLEDGLGFLGLTHDWSTISQIEQVVRADGRRLQLARRPDGDLEAHADVCRADALAARILGVVDGDGEVNWDREAPRVEVQVVIDLATLRGEADHPCLLDGMPVPADLAREVAGYAKAFRRMVTAPVTGHLLDYGRLVYLPEPLRTYVLARDGGCRTPGCTNRAGSRLQLDHAVPFPDGPSTAGNTGGRCTTCHQLKTAGHADVLDSRADGSSTWRTAWGQTVRVPPRSFLPASDDPTPQQPEPPPSEGRASSGARPPFDDPPPF